MTEIDLKATLKSKLHADFRKNVILGACNPPLAYQVLSNEPEIRLLLPCNVNKDVEQEGNVVSIIDPIARLRMVIKPNLDAVASEAQRRLQHVKGALGK